MNPDNKVLACVDQSPCAQTVADAAAWAARRMDATLELLHVLDRHPELAAVTDHSGTIGANAQEHLLQQLSADDEARTRAARESGRVFLNNLRERALAAGAPTVDTRQRHGELAETLTEQQDGTCLFVLGRKGRHSASTHPNNGHGMGRQVEWVVRSLARPVLVVGDAFKAPRRVLLAYDGSAITRKGVDMIAASPLFQGLTVHVLMAGKATSDGPRQLDWAVQTLSNAGLGVVPHIQLGDPQAVVGQAIASHGIDLLVMGAYTHSPLRSLFRGSHTQQLLKAAPVPTLLLR